MVVLSDDRSDKVFQCFVEALTYWRRVAKIWKPSIDGSNDLDIVMLYVL